MKNRTHKNLTITTGSFFKRVIGLLMVLLIVMSSISINYVVASPVMILTKSVDKSTVLVGESFVYTLRYANPSTTEDAEDVIVEDILPANIEYVSHTGSSDVQSVSVTNNGTNDVVRFIFKPVLGAGSTGFLKIEVRFPAGTTPETVGGNPNVAINSATIDPSNGDPVTSNTVTVTPQLNAAADWSITKSRIIPASVLPAVGNNVTYQVTVNANSIIGGLDLKDVVVTDTLPVGAVFVSASDGGTYDSLTGEVTWNIASLPVGTSQNRTVVINYPTPTFTESSTVTNAVLGTATQFDDTPAPDVNASVTHGFAAPTYGVGTFTKDNRQSNDRYSVGQLARFFLTNISNSGNMPIDKIEIVDNVPSEIRLTQISTGAYSVPCSVQVQYRTNLNANLRTWTGSPFSTPPNTTLNVSALGLGGTEYVTQVKWTITAASGQLMPGFANTEALNFDGIVSAPLVGNSITNTATLQAFNGATPFSTLNASSTIYIIDQYPWLVPIKTVPGGQIRYNYDDTVTFNLRIQNHQYATGNYVDPIAVDTIPPEYEDITYLGWDAGNSGISTAPVVSTTGTKTIGGITYTLLTADFTGTLLPGRYVNVQYSAKIKNMTDAGLLTNSLYISTLDNDTIYQNDAGDLITDNNDLDNDGSTTDRFVKSDASIFVNFQGSLSARKYIQGAEDIEFTDKRYPEYTHTFPGGYVNYRLVVQNTGSNGPITNVVMIDKLPTIGDTGVIDPSARDTQWTPYLVNLITGKDGVPLPAGVTVYYSTVVNPSCAEMNNPENHTNNPADGWTTTPPPDITTVKSIKVDFGSIVLNTGDEVVLEWPMRAPVGAPLGEKAWNSFGYAATFPDLCPFDCTQVIQTAFLPSEPIKVGFEIQLPPPYDVGDFVWEDMDKDGIQDAGEPGINNVLVNMYTKVGSNYFLYDYTRTGFDQLGNPGYYTFPDVPLGTYRMEFVYPKTSTDINGYTSTYNPSPGIVGTDRLVDSNGNPLTLHDFTDLGIVKDALYTPDFTINDITGDDFSIDQGLYRLCTIGDRVWYDYNADGLQTSGENGLAGVTVRLLDSAGNPAEFGDGSLVPVQTTNATGDYLFENLEPGVYKVRFDIPSDYKLSPANVGGNDAIDSDAIKDTGATATTADYTLLSGEQNLTVDAGLYMGHIGNLVFEDVNVDGIFNAGDLRVSGATVRLYKDGNPTAYRTEITNSSGIYSFDDLPPGNYVVEVVKPSAYDAFTVTSGTTPGTDNDSDVNRTTGRTANIVLAAGERIDTIDAGLYQFAGIGNYVWNDRNRNGIQNSGEPGISGVTVTLTDNAGNPVRNGLGVFVADVLTDANGYYSFTNLDPVESKDYKVVFTNPGQNYRFSPNNGAVSVANNSDGIWTNATDPTATTGTITIQSGSALTYVDQGMYLGHIGNLVFEDVNVDGIYNAGDTAIAGVTVNLYKDGDPNIFQTRTTNASGIYSFDDLFPGDYVIEVIKPGDYDKFTLSSGTTPGIDDDSDVDRTTGRTSNIVLTAGERIDTIDAGLYKFANIGDYVWNDRNMNGVQNSGEPGIPGVTVSLTDAFGVSVDDGYGNPVADVVTDANGYYNFPNLDPAVSKTYRVVFSNPNQDYKFSPNNGAITETTNSDGNIWASETGPTATTGIVTIASGSNITYVDQGMYLGHIGDFVFEDTNVNGVWNTGEPRINNVRVNLYKDGNPAVFKTTTTNSSGIYSFDDLLPGTYVVEFVRPTAYPKFTTQSGVAADAVNNDSDADRTTGRTGNIILGAGDRTDNVDAGMYRYASIGDRGWNDRNANGTQDSGEPGISGVTVRLTDALGDPVINGLGAVVADVTTDANGNYRFINLDPLVSQTYRVVFVNPNQDYALSPNNGAVTVGNNSDGAWTNVNDPTATTGIITVASNTYRNYVDQGMYLGALGDFVWDDYNANGRQDNGEPGISGVTVSLIDATTGLQARNVNGVLIAPTTTSATGAYRFDDLQAGDYIVQFSMPVGWDLASPRYAAIATTQTDSNADLVNYRSDTVTLTVGQRDFTIDGGFFGYAELGDYIWNDLNANGRQESGEPGIAGATVHLLDSGGTVIDSTTTNATGYYLFDELIPGTYAIRVDMPAGFDSATLLNQGVATADSNLDTGTLTSENVTLISRQENMTIDGGFYIFAEIGDYVWEDVNGNGIQDPGEPPLSGVIVNLLNGSGVEIDSTTTDVNGYYDFTSLVPGTYIIEVEKPTGYSGVTLKTQGTDIEKDSNLNPATARSDTVVLISGEVNMTIDAGLYRPVSLGDYVWHDTNANGIQDAGETGVENVRVNLLNSSGTQVDFTTTNAAGAYEFANLIPGTYFVEIVKPAGTILSPKYVGSDTTKDSNINVATSRSDAVTLLSGDDDPTIDAGLYQFARLGDRVWDDLNANGVQDPGEPGIVGTTVNLLDSGGTVIRTATTGVDGFYTFENLIPGTYTVEVPMPTSFDILTAKQAGGNIATDSNLNANFRSDPVTLVSGENNMTIDAGFYKLASLGDFIWDDLNANGIQDSGEPGIQGVTVNLLNDIGVQIDTATTDVNGEYSFTGLTPATYAIQVVKPIGYDYASPAVQGPNRATDSNLNTGTLTSANVNLISGQNDMTIDGGFYKLASLGDYVWNDLNEDGIQDPTEPAFENVTVELYDALDVLVDTTTTNANGKYLFDDLIPGDYYIKVIRPAGYIYAPQTAGTDTALDSNVDEITGKSETIFLNSGDDIMTFDAGLRLARPGIDIEKYVSLDGGLTWHDADTPKGPQYDPDSGENPRFKFIVTNTGNTRLTDIIVDDDVFGPVTFAPAIVEMVPGEIRESVIITQDYDFGDLVQTGPVDWIDNLNVSLSETSLPKNWDFRPFLTQPHDEGSWIIGSNYWTTGNWYYLGVIQPGETVKLPLSVLLDEELTTNEYMGATFYLQPKFEAIQITNEAVYDAWGMGYLPDINKWLPTTFDIGNSRWQATDNDAPPPKSYFWDTVLKIWDLII